LLGMLLDRAHELPPDLITPLVAEEVARIGSGRLHPLAGLWPAGARPLLGRGLIAGEFEEIDDTLAGALPTLPATAVGDCLPARSTPVPAAPPTAAILVKPADDSK
jgi:hypothetical protein